MKTSKREWSQSLKRRAPEGSKEWDLFNAAETGYEEAEALKNYGPKAASARNRANRAFKKAWALREQRLNQKFDVALVSGFLI